MRLALLGAESHTPSYEHEPQRGVLAERDKGGKRSGEGRTEGEVCWRGNGGVRLQREEE